MARTSLKRPKGHKISFTLQEPVIDQLYRWAAAYGLTASQALEHIIPLATKDTSTPITISVLPRGPAALPPTAQGPVAAAAAALSHPPHPAPAPEVMG